jgi:hypothetical protein
MQQTPDRDRPETNIPDLSKAAPVGSPYTNEEWKVLVETPVKICRAMMAVSPAGAIGMSKEIATMRDSFKEALQATTNPTIQNMGQYLKDQEKVTGLWQDVGHVFRDRWDAANVRQTAIASCQQAVALLKKASPQEAQAYKEFVYSTAKRVAEAAREGGFLGIGASKSNISEAEQSLLNDVARALELPRA